MASAKKKTTTSSAKKAGKKAAKKAAKKTKKKSAKKVSNKKSGTQMSIRGESAEGVQLKIVDNTETKIRIRTPLNTDKAMYQTARVSGAVFVVMGALLAVVNAQVIERSALLANIECATGSPECTEDGRYTDPSPYDKPGTLDAAGSNGTTENKNGTRNNLQVVTEVTSELIVQAEMPLSGVIEVMAETGHEVEVVTLYAFNRETRNSSKVGIMESANGQQFTLMWDTTEYRDGEYKLEIEIMDRSGAFYDGGHIVVQVGEKIFEEEDTSDETNNDDVSEEEEDEADPIIVDDIVDSNRFLRPHVSIELSHSDAVSEVVDVKVFVADAESVELYAQDRYSQTKKYLGRAKNEEEDLWRIRFHSDIFPNGEYKIFAVITNEFGEYSSEEWLLSIKNKIKDAITEDDALYINDLKTLGNEVDKELSEDNISFREKFDSALEDGVVNDGEFVADEPVDDENEIEEDNLISESEEDEEDTNTKDRALSDVSENDRVKLDEYLFDLRIAEREGNPVGVEEVRQKIDEFSEDLNDQPQVNDEILTVLQEEMDTIVREERIIRERVGDKVFDDSDRDGISDYDEVNLYDTDPFSADSDNDGFVDGAEIENGFDPKDDRREALIEYESPKERGTVREDILAVEAVETLVRRDEIEEVPDEVEQAVISAPKALIRGKGLPNSYITLYIFSTPIVVTVKTDEDGSWSYTFDKELEDGEHEVYVGVTDNAGRIVAKSNPFTFVKTAEAFVPVDANVGAGMVIPEPQTPGFLSENVILIVMSFIVIAMGLILILLGMHVEARTREEDALPQGALTS